MAHARNQLPLPVPVSPAAWRRRALALLLIALTAATASVAALTPGAVLVYRVGDGSAPLTTSSFPVFIDEYRTDGTLITSYPAPTAAHVGPPFSGAYPLTAVGSYGNEGMMTLSADGRYVVMTGYGIDPGARSDFQQYYDNITVPRVIGLLDMSGTLTVVAQYSALGFAGAVRGAASIDGTQFWIAGYSTYSADRGGVYYVSGNTSWQINSSFYDASAVAIFNSQLYVVNGFPGFYSTTPSLPTGPGAAYTPVNASPGGQWIFRDANTLYTAIAPNRYQFNGASWVAASFSIFNGTGLAGYALAPGYGYRLFSSTLTTLRTAIDDDVNASPAVATLATAAANTQFRSLVAIPPVAPQLAVQFAQGSALTGEAVTLTYTFTNPNATDIAVSMTHTLPVEASLGGAPSTSCSGSFGAASGAVNAAITLAPLASCTGSVDAAFATPGVKSLDVAIASSVGSASANATLLVQDTTPDAFSFTNATGVQPNTVQTSNTVSITGIDLPVPISVTGGQYSIGCVPGGFTPDPGTITNSETVCVRHTSAASYNTTIVPPTVLTVGGVTASFTSTTIARYTLTTMVSGSGTVGGAGIACPGDCTEQVDAGTAITLTAAAGAGSAFAGWSGGGCSGTGQCTVTLDADKTVTATFSALVVYNVVLEGWQQSPYVITNGGGTATATFNPVNNELTVDLSYTGLSSAETMAHIHGAAVRGVNAGVLHDLFPPTSSPRTKVVTLTGPQITMLQAGQLYINVHTASYPGGEIRGQIDGVGATVLRALTVVKSGSGTGTVAGTTEAGAVIDCGSDCGENVPHGKTVTLTATAAAGNLFVGWAGAGCTGTGQCVVTMDAAKSVTATFGPAQHQLTITKLGAGQGLVASTVPLSAIECGETCSATFAHGTVVTLVNSTAVGSKFGSWSGCTVGVAGDCTVTMDGPKTVSATFNLNTDPPRLVNIATRMRVLTGDDVMIGGVVIGGTAPKTVVIRARGPSMAGIVPGTLDNPQLQLFSGSTQIAFNDNWGDAANAAAIQSSGFQPAHPLESAILATLAPGGYTAIVTGVGGTTGVAIVEVFEIDETVDAPLLNIATRGRVLTGDDVMIAGLIVQGDGPQTVVVRARGPSLRAAGVPGVLENPLLQLFSGPTQIAVNDNWGDAANAAAIQASGFAPTDPNESAILMTLNPGAYTAIVTGVGGTTGVAIVEVFRN